MTRNPILLASLLASALCCASCSETLSTPQSPKYDVDVVTIEQQALEGIAKTPTRFLVDFSNETASWEKTKLFFHQYTSDARIDSRGREQGVWRLSSLSSKKDKYGYVVEKRPGKGGVEYAIACEPRGPGADPTHAQQNAKNLARFIREGNLELRLLDR